MANQGGEQGLSSARPQGNAGPHHKEMWPHPWQNGRYQKDKEERAMARRWGTENPAHCQCAQPLRERAGRCLRKPKTQLPPDSAIPLWGFVFKNPTNLKRYWHLHVHTNITCNGWAAWKRYRPRLYTARDGSSPLESECLSCELQFRGGKGLFSAAPPTPDPAVGCVGSARVISGHVTPFQRVLTTT